MPKMPSDELNNRQARFTEVAQPLELDGIALFHSHNVGYLSGFSFIPTERLIAYVASSGGEVVLVVPELEVEHASSMGGVERVVSYDEFPGDRIRWSWCGRCSHDLGLSGGDRRVGVDHDGYPPVWGYWGPALTDLVDSTLVPISRTLDRVMMVKSALRDRPAAHEQRLGGSRPPAAPGLHRGRPDGDRGVPTGFQRRYALSSPRPCPATAAAALAQGARAGYRGQIGRHGALPHSIGENIRFEPGDTLVTGATAPMWGYVSELERTMFMGPPSDAQRRLFDHMLALQDIGLAGIRPGVPASSVDVAVRTYFDRHDLWGYWRHHVGHAIGRRYHEAPFLDRGDDTTLEPGMVLTIEPGLYDPEWGGFRHSDTVVVTDNGSDVLTSAYPRDLASLIIPA